MGEPISIRKGKLAGRGKHDARLGRVVQVKKRGEGNPLILAQQEGNLLDDDCFHYHSWKNNTVIAFGTLSSFLI